MHKDSELLFYTTYFVNTKNTRNYTTIIFSITQESDDKFGFKNSDLSPNETKPQPTETRNQKHS